MKRYDFTCDIIYSAEENINDQGEFIKYSDHRARIDEHNDLIVAEIDSLTVWSDRGYIKKSEVMEILRGKIGGSDDNH